LSVKEGKAVADAYTKFITLLERVERRFWWVDFSSLKNAIERGDFRIAEVEEVQANFNYGGTGNLRFFWCRRCNRILEAFAAWGCAISGSSMMCVQCRGRATQAYVGAPRWRRGRKPIEYYDSSGQVSSTLVPISEVAWCRSIRGYRALRVVDEGRPIASATFACPNNRVPCSNRDPQGYCLTSSGRRQRLFFPSRRGVKHYPSHISEALTKPLILSTYNVGEGEPVSFDCNALPGVEEVQLAPVRIYELGILIFLGHSYASYSERMPRIPKDSRGPFMLGRKFETEGLVFRLKESSVQCTCDDLRERGFRSNDATVVAHSFAHAVLNALPLLSGLSPSEFGESLFVREKEGDYEVVVYDNSKGSIGGVRSIVEEEKGSRELTPDIYAYFASAAECKRGCEAACRACLFFERCIFLNKILNRHALRQIVSISGCRQYIPTQSSGGTAHA